MVVNLNLPRRRSVLIEAALYKRILSFIIDYLVIDFFILTYFVRPIKTLVPIHLGVSEMMDFIKMNPGLFGKLSLLLLMMGVLIMTYFTYSQKIFGQTVGMRLMGLILVNDDKKKKNIESWQFIVRNLYVIPLIPFVFLGLIDIVYLMIFNRKFSDVLAKLRLVEEKTL